MQNKVIPISRQLMAEIFYVGLWEIYGGSSQEKPSYQLIADLLN